MDSNALKFLRMQEDAATMERFAAQIEFGPYRDKIPSIPLD